MRRWPIFTIFLALIAAAAPARALDTQAEHAVLMDAATGDVLWSKDAETPVPPASMSKLMTLELLFQQLKEGRVNLNSGFNVSENAWQTQGSKSFVALGSQVKVEDLIRGIIIQSGNDACVVVAEALGGSVEAFARLMNNRAKELGLNESHFVNSDGLPDPPGQLMSAMDLARLARHLMQAYPEYYHYFGEKEFVYNNIRQPNRNLVLEKFPGADGLKTGHTDLAGYGVTASAMRNGERLILVLNGLRYPGKNDWWAEQYRGDEAARIFNIAFSQFHNYKLFDANTVVSRAKVWHGAADDVGLVVGAPLALTMEDDVHKQLKIVAHYDGPVQAPIAKGQRIGTLIVNGPGYPTRMWPLYASGAVDEEGIFGRAVQGLSILFHGKK